MFVVRLSLGGERESLLRVADLPRHVIPVDLLLLQEHVQAPLVLRQWMARDLVDEPLQSLPSLLDERVLEESVIAAEGELSLPRLARKCGHHNLERTRDHAFSVKMRCNSS